MPRKGATKVTKLVASKRSSEQKQQQQPQMELEDVPAKKRNVEDASAEKCTKFDSNVVNASIKIMTWNVAGLRAWLKKNAHSLLVDQHPDIVALQEVKIAEIPDELLKIGYHGFIDPGEKAGHSGVLLLTKEKPINVSYGSDAAYKIDGKGRLIFAEYDKFYLINAYVPNSGRGLVNLERRKKWDECFLDIINKLNSQKPIIYAGDLNVAHQEIDLANPKTNRNKTAGFTDQERNDFTRLLNAGYTDVYRHFNPDKKGAYTFWSNMHNAREKNVGWRLDYFVVSERFLSSVKNCVILSDIKGSDHCPLQMKIDI